MKYKIILLLLTIVFFVGCRSVKDSVRIKTNTKELVTKTDTTRVDSTRVQYVKEIEYVERTIIEKDSAMIQALLECNENGEVLLKQLVDYKGGKYIKPPKIDLKNNLLNITSEVDSLEIFRLMYQKLKVDSLSSTTNIDTTEKIDLDTTTKEKVKHESTTTNYKLYILLFIAGLIIGFIIRGKLNLKKLIQF